MAEELGFDGLMLNEHHDNAFCMGSVMNVEASILARLTKKVKIVLLGNPLPIVGNPLRLAEELAMIDLISGGRLVSGWVRGAGSEQFASNANPAFNREYFDEAHEVIIKAWTQPGPFRYEGKHFHYRYVDPWMLPMQKPHPQIWIPGLLSPETVEWCAKHRYPYVALATFLEPTVELWDFYRDAAAKEGYQVGTENFGYLQKVYVAETEEKAHEIAKWDMFGGAGIGYSLFAQPHWIVPAGIQLQGGHPAYRQAVHRAASKGRHQHSVGGQEGGNRGGLQPRADSPAPRWTIARPPGRKRSSTSKRRASTSSSEFTDAETAIPDDLRHAQERAAQDQDAAGSAASGHLHHLAERRSDLARGSGEQPEAAGPGSGAGDSRDGQGTRLEVALRSHARRRVRSPAGGKPESVGSLQPLRVWNEKAA